MLAHTGCWGGGFCLLGRQASMTGGGTVLQPRRFYGQPAAGREKERNMG